MKNAGMFLLIAGLGLQVWNLATDGGVFGESGALKDINESVPSVDLFGAKTNLATWLIASGAILTFTRIGE